MFLKAFPEVICAQYTKTNYAATLGPRDLETQETQKENRIYLTHCTELRTKTW